MNPDEMIEFQKSIEGIAERYHDSLQPDIHIENICQLFEIDWLKRVIPIDSLVIDMGYGDGLISSAVSSICKLTVVEGSKRLTEKAIIELPVGTGIVNALFEDYMPEELVDVVIASHVLEHVNDPIDILKRMSMWLKKDGIIIVIVPNKESIHRRVAHDMMLIESLDQLSERDLNVGHQRVYGIEQMISDLEAANFAVQSHRGFFIKPLSNAQMLTWDISALIMLNELSEGVPSHFCANLALIAKFKESN